MRERAAGAAGEVCVCVSPPGVRCGGGACHWLSRVVVRLWCSNSLPCARSVFNTNSCSLPLPPLLPRSDEPLPQWARVPGKGGPAGDDAAAAMDVDVDASVAGGGEQQQPAAAADGHLPQVGFQAALGLMLLWLGSDRDIAGGRGVVAATRLPGQQLDAFAAIPLKRNAHLTLQFPSLAAAAVRAADQGGGRGAEPTGQGGATQPQASGRGGGGRRGLSAGWAAPACWLGGSCWRQLLPCMPCSDSGRTHNPAQFTARSVARDRRRAEGAATTLWPWVLLPDRLPGCLKDSSTAHKQHKQRSLQIHSKAKAW